MLMVDDVVKLCYVYYMIWTLKRFETVMDISGYRLGASFVHEYELKMYVDIMFKTFVSTLISLECLLYTERKLRH